MERSSESYPELAEALKTMRALTRTNARAEQEIRGLQESFALVLRHGSDLVFRFDRDGKVLDISPACQTLLGLSPESFRNRSLQELVARDEQEVVRRYFKSVLESNVPAGVIIHLARRDRDCLALELNCRAVPHPQTRVLEVVGIACPVRAAATPATSYADLAFSLAHELNQPLTALALSARACCKLARCQEMDPQDLLQAIDQIAVQAERAGELVRRMRQLAVRATPQWSLVDVRELLDTALLDFDVDLVKERVIVELHVAPDLPKIKIDRIQVEQVLINLIRNAVEAMTDTPPGQRRLIIAASQAEAEVVIVVADTGRGLAPEMRDRLFEPYQTTKPEGMGLGLAVSRAILQAHAGRLWVEPTQGPGTAFCLALPTFSRES